MVSAGTPWEILGIERDATPSAVRRAYATLVKQHRPDDDPLAFARVREAYETLMSMARQAEREATAALAAASEAASVPADAQAREPARRAPVPVQDPPPKRVTPTSERERAGQAVLAIHERWVNHGQASALADLRALMLASRDDTLDARQDLEAALLHWLMTVEAPPLRIFDEVGLAFGWHTRVEHFQSLLNREGLHRLEERLRLARRARFAADAGPRWIRALFTPNPPRRTLPIGSRTAIRQAREWTLAWLQATGGRAGMKVTGETIDGPSWARVHGHALWSTDVLAGLCASALVLEHGWMMLPMALLVTLGCLGARRLWMHAGLRERLKRARTAVKTNSWVVRTLIVLVILGPIALMIAQVDVPRGGEIASASAIAAGGAVALWMLWRFLGAVEDLLVDGWLNLRMDHARWRWETVRAAAGSPAAPTAPRSWMPSGMRAAKALGDAERRTGERPTRIIDRWRARTGSVPVGQIEVDWRAIFWFLWAVGIVARVLTRS